VATIKIILNKNKQGGSEHLLSHPFFC